MCAVTIIAASSTMLVMMAFLPTGTGITVLAVRTMPTSQAVITIALRDDTVIVNRQIRLGLHFVLLLALRRRISVVRSRPLR